MALSAFVYISDVENLSDARFAAGMGVELIGFKLDPSDPSSLTAEKFKEISEWISGVQIVGEFGKNEPQRVQELLDQFNVDYILVSEEELLREYADLDVPIIFKINWEKANLKDLGATMSFCSGSVDYFLLEANKTEFSDADHSRIEELAIKYPIILGFGIHVHNASELAANMSIKGICLKGSPELRPGYKEFDEMADILESLEVD